MVGGKSAQTTSVAVQREGLADFIFGQYPPVSLSPRLPVLSSSTCLYSSFFLYFSKSFWCSDKVERGERNDYYADRDPWSSFFFQERKRNDHNWFTFLSLELFMKERRRRRKLFPLDWLIDSFSRSAAAAAEEEANWISLLSISPGIERGGG